MVYHSRISADPAYIEALGRAFYNFTYLEWIVVWTIVKLSPDGFGSVPRGKSSSYIAGALIRAIEATSPPLSQGLRHSLVKFHEAYLGAIRSRNKLLHAHPYTATGGLQRLRGGTHDWPMEAVILAAKQFESAALHGDALFHGTLTQERP